MNVNGAIHFYDDNEGKLYLDNGQVVRVNPRLFCSAYQAVATLEKWAKRRNLISSEDAICAA